MGDELYVVVEYNQASGRPTEPSGQIFDTLAEAQQHAEELTADNRQYGRREHYQVFRLEEVVDDHRTSPEAADG